MREQFIAGSGGGGGKSGGGGGGISEDPDNLSSIVRARFVDLIGEGQIAGLVNREFSIYLDGVPLKSLSGTPNYRPFRFKTVDGLQSQPVLEGFAGSQSETGVGLKILQTQGKVIRSITDADADAFRMTLSVQGLTETSSDGKISGSFVSFVIWKRKTTGSWVKAHTGEIRGKTTAKYQRSIEVNLSDLGTGPFEIAIERVKPDASSGLVTDGLFWDSFTVINYEQFTYPNSALAGIEIDARYFSSVPTRAYHVRGLLVKVPKNYYPQGDTALGYPPRHYATTGPGTTAGAWDGTFKIAYTDNPAWCYYDLLTNKRYGLGDRMVETVVLPGGGTTEVVRVDKWALYSIGKYCDGMVPTGISSNVYGSSDNPNVSPDGTVNAGVGQYNGNLEPRFRLNCVINTRSQAIKVLNQIASVFWGMAYWSNSGVTLTQDRPTPASMLYTNANVEGGLFRYEGSALENRYTVAVVSWNDPNEDFKPKFEYVEDRTGIARYGVRPTEVVAFGCTSKSQARRFGLWLLYTQRTQTEVVRFNVGFDSSLVLPGHVVNIRDNDYTGVRWGGRLTACTNTLATLDAPVTLTAGSYKLSAVMADGGVFTWTITLAAGTHGSFALPLAPTSLPITGAIWTLESTTVPVRQVRVVTVKNLDNGYEITALEHNPSKYAAIETGVGIETYGYSVISYDAVPAVTGLMATESSFVPSAPRDFISRLEISCDPVASPMIRGYELRILGSDNSVLTFPESAQPSWTLDNVQPITYTIGVKAVNALGMKGPETTIIKAVNAVDTRTPPGASGLTITTATSDRFDLSWTAPAYNEGGGPLTTNVYTSLVNDSATSVLAGASQGTKFTYPATSGETRYFWIRNVARNQLLQTGYSSVASATAPKLTGSQVADGTLVFANFASGLEPVSIVVGSTPPVSLSTRTIFLTGDGKLYRWNGSAYIRSVDGGDILANSIVAGTLASGAVRTQDLQAQAVTTDKLLVTGRGAVLNDDPGLTDLTAWTVESGAMPTRVTVSDGPAGTSAFRFNGMGGLVAARAVPAATGKQYRVSVWARRTSGTGLLYLRLQCRDAANNVLHSTVTAISPAIGTLEAITPSSSWTKYVGYIIAPSPTVSATINCYANYNTSGVTDIQDLRFEERLDASMVVEGLFQADNVLTRGLAVRDLLGNVIFSAGTPLTSTYITPSAGWVNSNITVDAFGTLLGIGTGGITVDNQAAIIGQNLMPNSDMASGHDWVIAYPAPNGAVIASGPDLARNVPTWDGTNYAFRSGTTQNVYVRQEGVGSGGNTAIAGEFWSGAKIACVPGTRLCGSVYFQAHRCDAMVYLQFMAADGSWMSGTTSGSQVYFGAGGAAHSLGAMSRYSSIGVVPAGAAFVAMFVRKYNTYAGQADSYLWWAAPQIEAIGAKAVGPSPYQPGPASNTRQLGYTGDLNASSDITFITRGPLVVNGNTIRKTGSDDQWNADAYSNAPFKFGACATATAPDTAYRVMFGLNSDPGTNTSYDSIDYALYFNAGSLYRYEAGNGLYLAAYAAGATASVLYDGTYVRYILDGVQVGFTYVGDPNRTFYFDSSFYDEGATLTNVKFAPAGNPSAVQPSNPITQSNAAVFIQTAAIQSAMVKDLRTANYAEDGSGNPAAGAKLASEGTALKVASGSMQVGSLVFSDYWFRLLQGLDGSLGYGRVFYRGSIDASVLGGAPNIDCLTLTTGTASQAVVGDWWATMEWKLQPTAMSDNLDAMRYMNLDLYQASGGSLVRSFKVPLTDRLYANPTNTNAANATYGSFTMRARVGFNGSGTLYFAAAPNSFCGHLLVTAYNAYGPSAQRWFHGVTNTDGAALSRDTTPPSGGPGTGGGGGGGTGGGWCPAPWVKVKLVNGAEVEARYLASGMKVLAVKDGDFSPVPEGGTLRLVQTIWAERLRLKLTNGEATEWSENHRFAVVDRGWTTIQNLRPGDHIVGMEEAVVESVIAVGRGQVVSFQVEGAGTYFGGGMLCHNYKQNPDNP